MPRFFLAGADFAGGTARITGSDAEHIKVLRLQVGSKVILSKGDGMDYHCRLTSLSKGQAEAEVVEVLPSPAEASVRVTVLAGMPKGERADFIVQKCTELGAWEICFFLSERCICRPDSDGFEKKRARWQRIAEEAAKQSGRGVIPKVQILPDFGEALNVSGRHEMQLFFYEEGPNRVPLHEALQGASPAAVSVVTGPEGGFAPYEAALAGRVGATVCSLGTRILRCETAPLAAVTAVMLATKNLG